MTRPGDLCLACYVIRDLSACERAFLLWLAGNILCKHLGLSPRMYVGMAPANGVPGRRCRGWCGT